VTVAILLGILSGLSSVGLGQEALVGFADYAQLTEVRVQITEIEVNGPDNDSNPDTKDWVEICNTGDIPVEVGGWVVEAEVWSWSQWGGLRRSDPIDADTVLQPGECLIFERANRWMTNDTVHAIRLYALWTNDSGEMAMVLVHKVTQAPVESIWSNFRDKENDERTLQLTLAEDGEYSWSLQEPTPGSYTSPF